MLKYCALLFVVLLAGCGRPKQQLNIFIWSEYIDPKITASFEREFGCKVNLDLFEEEESMTAKLAAGGTSLYDIVVPTGAAVSELIQRQLLAPLRHENIPNLKNVDRRFANPPFDPGNRFSAPYQWGTFGLYVRKPKNQVIEETWGLIFDPARQLGPFALIDGARTCFYGALKYRGYSLNSADPKELVEARDLLLDAKKRSLGFEGGVAGKNRVLAKSAAIAMVFNGDAVRGMKEDPETYYFVPREGSEMFLDNLCIPLKAPNRDLAEKFINYILDPKVGAQLSNYNQFATPNQASLEFINPQDRQNPAIYPPEEVMLRLEYARDLGEKQKLYDELWTQIKAK